jgi:membrane protein DedA with SNARE-associated domain
MFGIPGFWSILADHLYVVVLVGALIDATGLPFPGRVLLVIAGASGARTESDLLALVLLGALGAVLGDHLWYVIGRWGGDRPLAFYCRVSLGSRRCMSRAREYYERFGPATIVVGRFLAGVRIFTSPLAGSGAIPYWKFLTWDIIGAIVWAGGFVLLGWTFGQPVVAAVQRLGAPLIIGILLAVSVIGVFGVRLWRRGRYGAAGLMPGLR